MSKRVQWSLAITVVLAAMSLVNCGKYNCNTDDGLSFSGGCNSGSPSGVSSGGGTGSTSAFVFAVDAGATGSTNGTIDGFTLDSSADSFGASSGYTAPTVPANDGGVGMVIAQKQYLYVGFESSEQIYGWTIDSTSGSLTPIAGSPYTATFLSAFGGAAAEAEMITNPAGTLLFVSVPLENEIYAYQIGSGGALTPVTGTPFTAPIEPINLATDGQGKYLYASNGNFGTHTASEVAAFSIGTTGALTPVAGSPFAFPMWQLQGEPTGTYMIGTSGNSAAPGFSGVDDDNLYVFKISSTGAISPVSGSPFATVYSPFSIAVSPNSGGNLVYSFSFNDTATAFNAPEGYQISSTGALTAVSGSPFAGLPTGSAGSWGQFDQSGTLLLNYASFIDEDTSEPVTQLSPFSVASGGGLTQPIPTLVLTTQGFWAVTDPN